MNILGLSAFYHDSAAALMVDGRLVAAAQEERFTRIRHDEGFPHQAASFCLEHAGLKVEDLDAVAFYDKPLVKFERLLTTYLQTFPRSLPSFLRAMPVWLREKLWTKHEIQKALGCKGDILFGAHHLSHAASSFLVSPYESAAILTLDGVGEWSTTTLGRGTGSQIELLQAIEWPHSLGLLYSAFTYYLGFRVNSAEYKVMGLAPYGEPKYVKTIYDHLIEVAPNGAFRLNMEHFDFHTGLKMTSGRFDRVFGAPPRKLGERPGQREMDLAASVQVVLEEVVLRLGHYLHALTGESRLCMAGGVALNCVANGRLLREGPFEEIYIQPAAGDAGGAVGAAAWASHMVHGEPRVSPLRSPFLGPEYCEAEIKTVLNGFGAPYHRLDREALLQQTAQRLADQAVVGWFQGRMEFGPRALGARSILADPRNEKARDTVNLKIKFRESFRPFAPSILAERAGGYFSPAPESPYMLLTSQVRREIRESPNAIPAVTHVDGSARYQTVTREDHPLYYDLLAAFDRLTGCPVLVNTSFNVRGEPIVCTPEDAFRCFMATNMDVLVMGPLLLEKSEMGALASQDWRQDFEAD